MTLATGLDVRPVVQNRNRTRAIPPQLSERYAQLSKVLSEPTPGVVFEMNEVRDFVRITGDPNVIHTDTIEHPVIPGFQILASLGRYLDSKPPIFIDGYQTVIACVTGRFKQLVRIGAPLSLRYKPTNLSSDELGPRVDSDFLVQRTGTDEIIIEGEIAFSFVLDRAFNMLVRRACS